MGQQDIKTRMQTLLDSLDYDFEEFTLDGFVEWIAQQRERSIVFIPYTFPSDVSGAWVKGSDEDFIAFEIDTPAIHQTHIKLHEMAHMLCGHPTVEIGKTQTQALLRSVIGPEPDVDLQASLLRSTYSNENEEEAEMLTSLIQGQVQRHAKMEELYEVVESDHATAFVGYIETLKS
jgi:hypothetical protein